MSTEKSFMQMSTDEIMRLPLVIPEIENPDKLPLINIFEITPLQEDDEGNSLKEFTEENIAKLKRVIMTRGFKWPFYVFMLPDASEYLADGHGRRRLFKLFPPVDKLGNKITHFPALRRSATDLKDAAEQLAEITSQYQRTTQDGADWFQAFYEIDDDQVAAAWSFAGVFTVEEDKDEDKDEDHSDDHIPENFHILVICKTEAEQLHLLDKFQDEEIECRALIS